MAASALQALLGRARRLAGRCQSDRDLLERFVRDRDQTAFAALVERHGPMVLGVCRRQLGDSHQADDAFQATFLVLVRRAASVPWQETIGSWLYQVALRTSRKLRAGSRLRQAREREAGSMRALNNSPSADHSTLDLLDEEMDRLPRKWRLPVLLCCVQGLSKADAARELGWKEGTLSSRLARGRDVLRQRLERRGLHALAGGLAAVLTSQSLSATVAQPLAQSTVQAASTGPTSPEVAQLTQSMLREMNMSQLKIVAVVAASLLLVAGSAALVAPKPQEAAPVVSHGPETPPVNNNEADNAPVVVIAPVKTLGGSSWLHERGHARACALAPDGKTFTSLHLNSGVGVIWETQSGQQVRTFGSQLRENNNPPALTAVAYAPDGKSIAYWDGRHQLVHVEEIASGKLLQTLKQFERQPEAFDGFGDLRFSADGQTLLILTRAQFALCDWQTGKERRRVALPAAPTGVRNWAARTATFAEEGKNVALLAGGIVQATGRTQYALIHFDAATGKELGRAQVPLGSAHDQHHFSLSRDGQRLGLIDGGATITVLDMTTGKIQKSFSSPAWKLRGPGGSFPKGLAFSPDNRTIAVVHPTEVCLVDIASGKEIKRLKLGDVDGLPEGQPIDAGRHDLWSAAFAADGKSLLAPAERTVARWDVDTGKVLPRVVGGHRGPITGLTFAPDGRTLVSESYHTHYWGRSSPPPWDRTVRLWDLQAGAEQKTFDLASVHPDRTMPGFFFQVLADGKTLAWKKNDADDLHLRDLQADKDRVVKVGKLMPAAFSSDGRWAGLVRTGGAEVKDEQVIGFVHLWNLAEGKEVAQLRCVRPYKIRVRGPGEPIGEQAPPRYPPDHVCFSPDGKLVAAIVGGNALTIWDTATGQERRHLPAFAASNENWFRLERTGNTLASTYIAGSRAVGFTETFTGQSRGMVKMTHADTYTGAFALSADGLLLASAGTTKTFDIDPDAKDVTVHLIDVRRGREVARLRGHHGVVRALAFAPDGNTLASGSEDTTLRVWDVRRFRQPAAALTLDPAQLERLWTLLEAGEGVDAYQAVEQLGRCPQSAAFLKDKLQPIQPIEAAKLKRLVADLDSTDFTTRQQATDELEKLAELAQSALDDYLKTKPGLEGSRRAERILAGIKNPAASPKLVRQVRALEALERLGTPAARDVLKQCAAGAPAARLTREARAALGRLPS